MMGRPADKFSERIHWLPRPLWQRLSALSLRFRNGTNRMYGLPEPDGPIGSHHPTINEDLFYSIRHGKIRPRPDIERLEGKTVVFKDGGTGTYDTVIACTGYVISHPFFDSSFIDYSRGEVRLWLRMLHPDIDNLYFIGLFQPLGCIWPGSELQSRIMAAELSGRWKRPSDVGALADRENRNPDFRQIDTPRHTITVDFHRFRKRLLEAFKRYRGDA
jgi:hypothetical protein